MTSFRSYKEIKDKKCIHCGDVKKTLLNEDGISDEYVRCNTCDMILAEYSGDRFFNDVWSDL